MYLSYKLIADYFKYDYKTWIISGYELELARLVFEDNICDLFAYSSILSEDCIFFKVNF